VAIISASTTVLSEAALRPARWRASSCRPKLGGALKTSQPPPRPRASAAPCMLAHPSTELVARAPCQLRRAHARSVRAARARLRQQRRLEVDTTRKRDAQTGGPAGPSRGNDAGTFFLGGGFPVDNWGSISWNLDSAGLKGCHSAVMTPENPGIFPAGLEHDRRRPGTFP
jgi:hypothetical protein